MDEHTYRIVEVVGTSTSSIADAVRNGVECVQKDVGSLEWFEVTQIRGHIEEGAVGHFQVSMKLGSRYEASEATAT